MKPREMKKLGLNGAQTRLAAKLCEQASANGQSSLQIRDAVRALIADPSAHRDDPHFGLLAQMMTPGAFNEEAEPAPWRMWGTDLDPQSIRQMENACRLPVAWRAALMPDAHVGYGLPIGGVLATKDAIIPYAVGVDIACRMRLSIVDMPADAIKLDRERLIKVLEEETRFGMGASFSKPHDHEVMAKDWGITSTTNKMKQRARSQLGSSGSGNHFVEWGIVTLDKPDMGLEPGEYLALLSHSGSRGAGATVADYYSKLAQELHPELPDELRHLAWLDMDRAEGQEYWAAMNLMGDYAAANHAVIHREMLRALGVDALHVIENHHNFCIPGDALVATPRGPVPMDQIVEGDEVYAMDEARGLVVTKVLRHWVTGVQPVKVIQTSNRRISATENHPVLTIVGEGARGGQLVWKDAGALVEGDVLVCAEGYFAQDGEQGEALARLVGAFIGDGWIRHDTSHGRYTVGLAIGDTGEAHTTAYKGLLEELLPAGNWQISRKGAFGITCASAKVHRAVVALGLGDYSKEKRVPRWAFSLPLDAKLALLAGYMDADGYVADEGTSNHGRGVLASTNGPLIRELRELAVGAGLRITPVQASRTRTNFGDATVYRCTLSADSVNKLPLWHSRKALNKRATLYNRPQGLVSKKLGGVELPRGCFAQKVRSVTDSDAIMVYDLTVEDASHSFIVEGVVVHNCWKEEHDGEEVYVHRKGATPAGQGVMGIIPGSMATPAYVVRGRGSAESLRSASHGAGRVMSRRAAQREVDWQATERMLAERDVTLLSAGVDEAPAVYKDIQTVMNAQQDLVDIVARFMPRIVKMAPSGEPPED